MIHQGDYVYAESEQGDIEGTALYDCECPYDTEFYLLVDGVTMSVQGWKATEITVNNVPI